MSADVNSSIAALFAQSAVDAQFYTNTNLVHPLAVALLLVVSALIFVTRPGVAVALVLGFSFLVVPSQRVIIFTVDMPFYRIIGLIAMLRLMTGGSATRLRLETSDLILAIFIAVKLGMALIRGVGIMNPIGQVGDLGLYYLIGRLGLRDRASIISFLTVLAAFMPLLFFFMVLEKSTTRNLFSIYGGVFEFTPIRFGKLRAQAAFVHPIIGGVVFATLIPLFVGMWVLMKRSPGNRILQASAILCSIVCVFATASSTPLLAMFGAFGFFLLYPFRAFISTLAQFAFIFGVSVHLLSNGGLHHLLFARLSFVTGSTGYHRYMLWDSFLQSFTSWFLAGQPKLLRTGANLADVTCEYIAVGLSGGMLLLIIFLGLLAECTRVIVGLVRASSNPSDRFLAYSLGAWLFANCLAFSAVTYFGQGVSVFAVVFGGVISLGSLVRRGSVRPKRVENRPGARGGRERIGPAAFS